MYLKVTMPAGRRNEALGTLRCLLAPTRVQPGCLSCELFQEPQDDHCLLLTERWESIAALERHIRSDGFRRILALLDLSTKGPELRFDTVSETRNFDLVARILEPKASRSESDSTPLSI